MKKFAIAYPAINITNKVRLIPKKATCSTFSISMLDILRHANTVHTNLKINNIPIIGTRIRSQSTVCVVAYEYVRKTALSSIIIQKATPSALSESHLLPIIIHSHLKLSPFHKLYVYCGLFAEPKRHAYSFHFR
ncbi:MAG: hypothetical protein WHU54_02380 [Candidatus Bathyarchaeia archaeon]